MDLNDRSRDILKAIINSYIATAEPVGSRTVTKRYELGISSATVRNIMADLEELGFLAQPHTSAGRVPTDKAYRFYIDTMLEVKPVPEERIMKYSLPTGDFSQLMQETTNMLSSLTHYTGIVMAPKPAETVYKHIEFIRIDARHALAIFVSSAGIIHNRMVNLDDNMTHKELEDLSAFLNKEFTGKTLGEMRSRLTAMMDEDRNRYNRLLSKLMKVWQESAGAQEATEADVFYGGLTGMFDVPDFRDIDKMKELFYAFEEKHRLVSLLDRAIEADGVQVFIGSENKFFDMQGVSLVVARYKGEGNIVGTLGVIGPSRMPYNQIIPLVDCTARVLGRLISGR
jgi:heat-inducible transcriptional repressor